MPQVASAPVISPPVRSDAPARAPGQGESSGAFGEMLEASSAAPDAGDGKPASAKSKESSLPAAQEEQIADLVQTANASIQPVVAIDLALLAPELSVEGSAAVPVAVTETDDGEPTASGDANTEDTKTQANGDATSVSTDPKGSPKFRLLRSPHPHASGRIAPIASYVRTLLNDSRPSSNALRCCRSDRREPPASAEVS